MSEGLQKEEPSSERTASATGILSAFIGVGARDLVGIGTRDRVGVSARDVAPSLRISDHTKFHTRNRMNHGLYRVCASTCSNP
jgi:hypothetical protein